jgi:tight adherence protein B
MIFVALAFVLALGLILGIYWTFVVRPEQQVQDAFWRRLKSKALKTNATSGLLRHVQHLSAVPAFDAMLRRGRSGLRPAELLIEQSGVRMTLGTFLVGSGLCGLIVTVVAQRFIGVALASLALGVVATMIPLAVLRMKRTRRLLNFEEQFPEALALMSRALKAGHAFTTGLSMVAEEMPAPLGPEFKLLYDQQNYGLPLPDALKEFARRIPLLDGRFFVTAVLIQRESGGNLSEVLDNIASVIRDRFKVKRQIQVISAHGRLTGMVLCAVPPALALVLFAINPDHWKTLTGNPLGVRLIITGIVLQLLGTLIIQKLVKIEY